MRKLSSLFLILSLIVLLCACNKAPGTPTTVPSDPSQGSSVPTEPENSVPEDTGNNNTTVTQKPMASVSVPAVVETTTAADGTVIFQYTYQDITLVLQDPDVAASVVSDLKNRIAATKPTADSLRQLAQSNYTGAADWYPYQCQIIFEPMRMDHGILSMFGNTVTYSGAAKPDPSYQGTTYNLVTGDMVHLLDIFSRDDWAASVTTLVTEVLEAKKADLYLYDDYVNTVNARFSGDLSSDTHWYFTSTGLCFFFAPYDIAPYSSGVITAEIPYEKLTDILDAAYFPAETDAANGAVTTELFSVADLSKFNQICELTLDPNGIAMLLYTDSSVQDVRISVLSLAGQANYTAFASYTLTPGDAIMLQVANSTDQLLLLSYVSGGITVSETITLPNISG